MNDPFQTAGELYDELRTTPVRLYEELQSAAKHEADRLSTLTKLKAPDILIENSQMKIEILMTAIKDGHYAVTPAEIKIAQELDFV
jgi:hypothetical protein